MIDNRINPMDMFQYLPRRLTTMVLNFNLQEDARDIMRYLCHDMDVDKRRTALKRLVLLGPWDRWLWFWPSTTLSWKQRTVREVRFERRNSCGSKLLIFV